LVGFTATVRVHIAESVPGTVPVHEPETVTTRPMMVAVTEHVIEIPVPLQLSAPLSEPEIGVREPEADIVIEHVVGVLPTIITTVPVTDIVKLPPRVEMTSGVIVPVISAAPRADAEAAGIEPARRPIVATTGMSTPKARRNNLRFM
jgi:hypothetical protein